MGEICHYTDHVIDECSVNELRNNGFSHEGNDIVSLSLVLFPFSQFLANCCKDVVDDGGENSHREGKHVAQDYLSGRLVRIGRRGVSKLVILQS